MTNAKPKRPARREWKVWALAWPDGRLASHFLYGSRKNAALERWPNHRGEWNKPVRATLRLTPTRRK